MAVTVAVMGSDEDDVRRVAAQVMAAVDGEPLGGIMRLAFRDPSGWMLRYEVDDPPGGEPSP